MPNFDPDEQGVPNSWAWDRFSQFALVATLEALRDAGLEPGAWPNDSRVAVIIGSGAGGTASFEEQYAALMKEGPLGVSPLTLRRRDTSALRSLGCAPQSLWAFVIMG